MIKTPTRKREFSQFRQSPAPHITISRRTQNEATQTRPLTPTPSRNLLTPTNAKLRESVHQRTTSTRFLNVPGHTPTKENRSHSKHGEICVNCVNEVLVEQHRAKHKKEIQEEQRYAEQQRQIAAEEAQRQRRKEQERKIRDLQFSRALEKETKKERERTKAEQAKRREVENLRLMNEREAEERHRKQEVERVKKERFKRDLEQQVRDELERRKAERQTVSRQKEEESAFKNIAQAEALRQEASAKKLNDYRTAIRQQIQDNQERARKAKEEERAWQERLRELERSRPVYEPKARVVEAANDDYLRQQIKQRSNRKLRQLERERLETEEAARIAEQQYRDSIKRQNDVTHNKREAYMRELDQQIRDERQRKLKELSLEKEPAFTEVPEERKPQLQDCDRCHHLYPKNYLSVFDY